MVHEADLADALGSERPPDEATRLGTRSGIARWRTHLLACGVESLRLEVGDWRAFCCGERSDDALVLRVGA